MEMSERSPEQQPKKEVLTDTCDGCGVKYRLTKQNAEGRHYEGQQDCDYILCSCPKCSFRTRIFVSQHVMKLAIEAGITVVDEEPYADEETYQGWLRVNNIELPKSYELTDRHEAIIHKFGEAVLNMPDQLLYDGFHDETDRPYPNRWT